VFEANDLFLREFGAARLLSVIDESRDQSPREIVDSIFDAVQQFRGEALPNDDMTAVAVKINV
jgi:serine phosphatase RsbU (regulator of sigma subunit)